MWSSLPNCAEITLIDPFSEMDLLWRLWQGWMPTASIVFPAWKHGLQMCMCTLSGTDQRWHRPVCACVRNSCRSKVVDFHVIVRWFHHVLKKVLLQEVFLRSLLDLLREESSQQWHLRPWHVLHLHVCLFYSELLLLRGAGAGMEQLDVQVSHFDGYNKRWPQSSRPIDERVIALTLISGLKKLLISVWNRSIAGSSGLYFNIVNLYS